VSQVHLLRELYMDGIRGQRSCMVINTNSPYAILCSKMQEQLSNWKVTHPILSISNKVYTKVELSDQYKIYINDLLSRLEDFSRTST
jgi:hypothetical protein